MTTGGCCSPRSSLFTAAWFTDKIGLYAVFGAFCVGVVFPRNKAADPATAIAPLARIVFVPLFFTYSGLNTRLRRLGNPGPPAFAMLAVVVSIVGKLGACWGAARAAAVIADRRAGRHPDERTRPTTVISVITLAYRRASSPTSCSACWCWSRRRRTIMTAPPFILATTQSPAERHRSAAESPEMPSDVVLS